MSSPGALAKAWLDGWRTNGEETTLAGHLERSPIYRPLASANEMASIGARTLRVAFTPPFGWVRDAIVEASIAIRRCTLPISISALTYVIGFATVLLGAIVYAIGAVDREPSGVYTGLLRELITWITMMILAGVAGSALAADLGARKIRDELDALTVLGVDTFRLLVVPRVMGMTLVGLVLPLLVHIITTVGNMLAATVTLHLPLEPQINSILLVMNPYDLVAACFKHLLIGFFLGVVACQKGLSARGGAEGVGRAVNESVVVSFFGIWLINSIFNISYLTLVPDALGLKG